MSEPTVVSFQAMGSPCRIVTDAGADEAANDVQALIQSLDSRWSRFITESEVSALNRSAGRVTVVSDETFNLVNLAVRAQEWTDGIFNPLMADQLEALGYDRSWPDASLRPSEAPIRPATTDAIVLYPEINAVRLPDGARFDPGGIGKGLAIDLAIDSCRALGLAMASVELGGDLKVYGTPWFAEEWRIGVADPLDPHNDVAFFSFIDGAVTTSTTAKRSWVVDGRRFHHLLDPATGYPSVSDVVSVTTCSEMAWWAEVVAKSALVVGSDRATELLDRLGIPGVVITTDGTVLQSPWQESAHQDITDQDITDQDRVGAGT